MDQRTDKEQHRTVISKTVIFRDTESSSKEVVALSNRNVNAHAHAAERDLMFGLEYLISITSTTSNVRNVDYKRQLVHLK
jgi:hypothetical protein